MIVKYYGQTICQTFIHDAIHFFEKVRVNGIRGRWESVGSPTDRDAYTVKALGGNVLDASLFEGLLIPDSVKNRIQIETFSKTYVAFKSQGRCCGCFYLCGCLIEDLLVAVQTQPHGSRIADGVIERGWGLYHALRTENHQQVHHVSINRGKAFAVHARNASERKRIAIQGIRPRNVHLRECFIPDGIGVVFVESDGGLAAHVQAIPSSFQLGDLYRLKNRCCFLVLRYGRHGN